MKVNLNYVLPLALGLFFLMACDKDDDNDRSLELNISGLEDLGSDYAYEGWLIVNGQPVSTGVFTVDGNGDLSETSFDIAKADLNDASTFVLTIEPSPDADPLPSDVHILAGDFIADNASLNVSHGAALANDFSGAVGKYILATPTDGANTNENSGIWFLDLSSGSPGVGLMLPALPNGWIYEGWAVSADGPISSGTFNHGDMADLAAPYSGNMMSPPFPGEDFLMNAPSGQTFPLDLAGGTAVISIEPVPDNSTTPFLLKPLVGQIPAAAKDHETYDLGLNLNFPTGTASR
jgi:hypothetical protein